MGILSRNAVTVSYLGMPVCVPRPEAYALHKMAINAQRKGKQEKDIAAVRGIWPFLNKEAVSAVMETLTKKELRSVEDFIDRWLK